MLDIQTAATRRNIFLRSHSNNLSVVVTTLFKLNWKIQIISRISDNKTDRNAQNKINIKVRQLLVLLNRIWSFSTGCYSTGYVISPAGLSEILSHSELIPDLRYCPNPNSYEKEIQWDSISIKKVTLTVQRALNP